MKIIENNTDDYSVCEYNALKSELNTISNQASTAIVTIISAWAAGITLIVIFLEKNVSKITSFAIIGFLEAFIFLIPILYFIPLAILQAQKNRHFISDG